MCASRFAHKLTAGDVTKRGDWENVVKVAQDTYGGLNYVINNAGATYKSKPVLTTTEADFDLCIDVNLKSIFHSVHVAVPVLQKTTAAGQPAAVINIASTAGIMGRPGLTWYCGSKAAVISCTKNLSIEFGKQQIVSVHWPQAHLLPAERRTAAQRAVEGIQAVTPFHLKLTYSASTPFAPCLATLDSSPPSSARRPRTRCSPPSRSAASHSLPVSSKHPGAN